ncbi:uncharacterized protein LOC143882171 [Tasmannia lanceolata]|uniref:uncharacterized protein LOC143882171 n=1 Tax=Tasmannia lanceolata TaxID=3420 RepID=UPI004063043B
MARTSARVDLVDSDDEGDKEEVFLDLNATPLPTVSLSRAEGSVESDVAEASTTFPPGQAVEGGGSSKSGGASTGTGSGARLPTGLSEHVFRPNWAVLKDDTALGESRVAAELMSKCLLRKDKQQILYEPPATGEEAVLSSAYQILFYYNDLKEKSKKFSQAITASEEVNGKLAAEVQELQTSIGRIEEERRLLKEDLAAEKKKLVKAAEAMEAQRGRATERQEKAVKEATEAKEAELFSLSSEAYSLGYYDCLQELQA